MLTRPQAIELWHDNDLISLGMQADEARKRLHPEPVVSYTLQEDKNAVEYTFDRTQSIETRLDALEDLLHQQLRTGEIAVFRPLVDSTATGVEYLKMLALSRLYLDNVPHLQGSHKMFGLKVAQISLRFGANDLGIAEGAISEEEIRRLIRDAGYVPKQRDALFRTYSVA